MKISRKIRKQDRTFKMFMGELLPILKDNTISSIEKVFQIHIKIIGISSQFMDILDKDGAVRLDLKGLMESFKENQKEVMDAISTSKALMGMLCVKKDEIEKFERDNPHLFDENGHLKKTEINNGS